MRYELTDLEWSAIKPFLPNKPRGVPRVNDRRVRNGSFGVLRSGAPWRDLPQAFGPYTTCYNRFVRWRRAGVWERIMNALASAHDAAVQMTDTSLVRVHRHAACVPRNRSQSMGRSRGGLTTKIHATSGRMPGIPRRLPVSLPDCYHLFRCRHRFRMPSQIIRSRLARHQAPNNPNAASAASPGRKQ